MDKKIVLEQSKQALHTILNELTLENYEEKRSQFIKYLDFIQVLRELPEIANVVNTESVQLAQQPSAQNETQQALQTETLQQTPYAVQNEVQQAQRAVQPVPFAAQLEQSMLPQSNRYRFERKLRGGILSDLGDGYFIPEMVVRDLGIEHGDLLEIEGTKVYGDQTRHTFKVVEKGSGDDPSGRVEFKYCIIEKIGGLLCVSRQMNGEDLKLNGLPFSFVLKQGDVIDLRLVEGDIVDIAYYVNRPDETMKVVWKHDSSKLDFANKTITKPSKKEIIKEAPKPEKELPIDDPELFKGKKVLVVGAKPKEAGYKSILESLGSTVEVFAGTESKSRTRGAIQKSDVVVMVTAYLGHGKSSGSPQVVDMCKKAKVPFGFVDNMGNQSFLLGVEEVLKRSQKEKELVTV